MRKEGYEEKWLRNRRSIIIFIETGLLIILDIILTVIASVTALVTRFEFNIMQIPEEFSGVLMEDEIFFCSITLIIFGIFRIYSSLWEYAGLEELSTLSVQ